MAIAEQRLTTLRLEGLHESNALAITGFDRLCAIHHYVFQDVYAWAGQARTVPIGKAEYEGSPRVHHFTDPREIAREARRIFDKAAAADYFKGLTRSEFVERAAEHFAEVNQLHTFREGNGRAQRAYIRSVAREAGHALAFISVSHERMVAASIAASQGDPASMRAMFDDISDPSRAPALALAAKFLDAQRERLGADWNERGLACAQPGEHVAGTFVVSNGEHAIVLARWEGKQLFVLTNAADIPADLVCNDPVQFTVTRTPFQRAQQWLERVESEAPAGTRVAGIKAGIESLRQDAASGEEAKALLSHVEEFAPRILKSALLHDEAVTNIRSIDTDLSR